MAQNFVIDNQSSNVKFLIKNLGLNVNGSFSGFTGTALLDSKDLTKCKINVSVDASTLSTSNKERDKHLKNEDYFDIIKYPQLSFDLLSIAKTKRLNRYLAKGNFIIKGIVKPLEFEVIIAEKENLLTLKCDFEMNRRNFKIGGSSLVLSDNVKVSLLLTFNESKK